MNLARGWRGGERQTLLLMQGLRERGCESWLAARAGEELSSRAAAGGFGVIEVRKPYLWHSMCLRGFDIVHAHETRALQWAALAKGFYAAPLVGTRRVAHRPSSNLFSRFKYRRADCVVAISTQVAGVMREWGLSDRRLRVIPSAVEPARAIDPERVARLRNRFAGLRVVGCVAALSLRDKDHLTLLEAFRQVSAETPDLALVLIGDGRDAEAIRGRAQALRLRNVFFEGFQNDPYSYYRVMDVFVLTSRLEGLGSAILDAFAYGVPVVATAAGGVVDLVQDGKTGILAVVEDPQSVARGIRKMLQEKPLSSSCVRNANALLEARHGVPAMAAAYQELYGSLRL